VPESLRKELALRRADFGIDIVARKDGKYHAVQCKYRERQLGWSELSTFEALCQRTGPWQLHWVMTTAPSVRRIGRRGPKDKSYCIGSWRGLSDAFWLEVAQLQGQTLDCNEANAESSALVDAKAVSTAPQPSASADAEAASTAPQPSAPLTQRQRIAQMRIDYFSQLYQPSADAAASAEDA